MIRVIYINDAGDVDEFLCDWVDFNDAADEVICYSNGSNSIRIFKPISIVGFDGIFGDYSSGLCLTTVVQDAEKKGIMSAELLYKVLDGEEVESHQIFPFEFRIGNTLKEINK